MSRYRKRLLLCRLRLQIADSGLPTAEIIYHSVAALRLKGDTRDQLQRAARSVALNLAEGRGRKTKKDQVRFFNIAMGSLRECQAVLLLEHLEETTQWKLSDKLGAHLYKLIQYAQ